MFRFNHANEHQVHLEVRLSSRPPVRGRSPAHLLFSPLAPPASSLLPFNPVSAARSLFNDFRLRSFHRACAAFVSERAGPCDHPCPPASPPAEHGRGSYGRLLLPSPSFSHRVPRTLSRDTLISRFEPAHGTIHERGRDSTAAKGGGSGRPTEKILRDRAAHNANERVLSPPLPPSPARRGRVGCHNAQDAINAETAKGATTRLTYTRCFASRAPSPSPPSVGCDAPPSPLPAPPPSLLFSSIPNNTTPAGRRVGANIVRATPAEGTPPSHASPFSGVQGKACAPPARSLPSSFGARPPNSPPLPPSRRRKGEREVGTQTASAGSRP
ncbi:hypothetical protein OF83DRAFT_793678 [Amylostereum chailletii]|nr:hypothetical protein OF83DRAFT_793678 [Amylostereum chailletii]